ncbi:hypothetical protein OAH12_01490, partial [Cyclobacteriaceae bacterium]|nr:hypothetical protein [Cyclobacteriaceae bacterium]
EQAYTYLTKDMETKPLIVSYYDMTKDDVEAVLGTNEPQKIEVNPLDQIKNEKIKELIELASTLEQNTGVQARIPFKITIR